MIYLSHNNSCNKFESQLISAPNKKKTKKKKEKKPKQIQSEMVLSYFTVKTCYGYLLNLPHQSSFSEYPQGFYRKEEKYQSFFFIIKMPYLEVISPPPTFQSDKQHLFFFCFVFLLVLIFISLCPKSAIDKLIFFSYISQKRGFDFSCKLSPLEAICMKCQILFSEKKIKKKKGKFCLQKVLPSMQSDKWALSNKEWSFNTCKNCRRQGFTWNDKPHFP